MTWIADEKWAKGRRAPQQPDTSPPAVGQRRYAYTTGRGNQRVLIEITAIDVLDAHEAPREWLVYGYRVGRSMRRGTRTQAPQLYAIPKDTRPPPTRRSTP